MKRLFVSSLCILTLLATLFTFSNVAPASAADSFVIASGAGYKKVVNALTKAYEKQSGVQADRIYGNMAKVTSQAKMSGKVDLVLGAKYFLEAAGLDMGPMTPIGKGPLVIAWAKGVKFDGDATFLDEKIGRIAIPDLKNAIYGRAGKQYLDNTGLYPKVKDKLIVVATIPQVFSYLMAKEVDLGFLNKTHAMNVADKLGGYVLADESKYEPIVIAVGKMNDAPHGAIAEGFVAFLKTPQARKIITAHGL
ncbi:MAG: molybdate ABC transporter substrate-binding protein [Desulfovibrio sp.]|uniref:molybdate ABC transporter substrate-binding protein n=1 Tax=Desulfovibrio sp. 7SRBS1 TaxID=3378064 RepID=UPI003B409252